MIKYTEAIMPSDLSFLPDGVLKVRASSLLEAYGAKTAIADFWLAYDGDAPTALLCGFSGEVTAVCTAKADLDEIACFLPAVAASVLCDTALAEKLSGGKERFCVAKRASAANVSAERCTSPRELYSLLASVEDGRIELPDRDEWYADLSHRFRHGTAEAVRTENAAALAGFISGDAAIVTGVAVSREHRGKGEGRRDLLALANALYPKKLFAICEKSVLPFYEKCGFTAESTVYRIKFRHRGPADDIHII